MLFAGAVLQRAHPLASLGSPMTLPIKTTADDVRKIVSYLKTKPTGATVTEARAVDRPLVDGRKLAAYRAWGIIESDGDKLKLTQRGWSLARNPADEKAIFGEIIDSVSAYRSVLEWAAHQEFESVNVVDVSAHWHDHHRDAVGAETSDSTIQNSALAFIHLAQAAGLGQMTLGRRGNPTRLDFDRSALAQFIESGPSTPPWEADDALEPGVENDGADDQAPESGQEASDTALVGHSSAEQTSEVRVFIAHGKNLDLVEQIQTMLELADIESEVAEDEETTAIPVPEKVFTSMRRCTAGIITVSAEQATGSDDEFRINENVLIEIGAAFVLYDRRVVLLWDKRLPVPSNLQGLYRCEFEGDELSWSAGMKLMKAIRGFRD